MKYLGIDFGLKKIGLAISEGDLPAPLKVIKIKSPKRSLNEIKNIVEKEKIDKIVIGISEGKIAKRSEGFAALLKKTLNLDVVTEDETLSSQYARNQLIIINKQRKKRKKEEDAVSACLILENYFHKHV